MNNKLLENLRTFLLDITVHYEDTEEGSDSHTMYQQACSLFDALNEIYGYAPGDEPGYRNAEIWWIRKE